MNAASWILMFTGAATRFIINTDFQMKLLLMALAGRLTLIRNIRGSLDSRSPCRDAHGLDRAALRSSFPGCGNAAATAA